MNVGVGDGDGTILIEINFLWAVIPKDSVENSWRGVVPAINPATAVACRIPLNSVVCDSGGRIAVAINPLYKAPIIFLLGPNLTKKVPAIEVRIQDPPIANGYIIMLISLTKKIDAKTIVATIVTA